MSIAKAFNIRPTESESVTLFSQRTVCHSLYGRVPSLPSPQRMRPTRPVSHLLISHMSAHPAVCRGVYNHDKSVTSWKVVDL